jgi:hypothetical protein
MKQDDKRTPLYFIDRIAFLDRNEIFGVDDNNFVRLDIPCDEGLSNDTSDRNRFVKNAYGLLVPRYELKTAAHICGINHISGDGCIPIQEMIKARRYILIDAVSRTETLIPSHT